MAVTIKDIAKLAGVTHSTVSRCLNDKPGVSDSMRVQIKKIADDLGFEFNANARGLNTSRTGTIGIILNEDTVDGKLHFFTNSFLSQIRSILEKEDLDILTSFSQNSFSHKNNIMKLVNRKKVDGLILLSSSISPESISFLNDAKIPFVFSHQIPDPAFGKTNAVYCDHYKGAVLATQHLIDRGRRNILCVKRENDREEFRMRTDGYCQTLIENGLEYDPAYIIPGGYSLNSGRNTMERIEPFLGKIDGIFAHTDLLALGVMKELKRRGIRIPEDISLVGYDNIELCTYVEPNLTSINQPSEKISENTCKNLISQLSGSYSSEVNIITPNLIIRESS